MGLPNCRYSEIGIDPDVKRLESYMAFEEVFGVAKKEMKSVQLIQKDGIGFRVVRSFGFGGYRFNGTSCE